MYVIGIFIYQLTRIRGYNEIVKISNSLVYYYFHHWRI